MSGIRRLLSMHRRMPIVFGPFPGPRQSFDGHRRNGAESTSAEAFITFQTSKEQVLDLLPPGFTFQSLRSTSATDDAYVTITSKALGNLEWLGGRGYHIYSYYIHGVQYAVVNSSQQKTYQGTYLPVLWENLADPILSGREELGFPKLFADMRSTFEKEERSMTTEASWQGTKFADFHLSGLSDTEENMNRLAPAAAGVDDGIFVYKSIPATGKPGTSDVEYPIFVPYAAEREIQPAQVLRTRIASGGRIRWDPADWERLPTLHHIVSRLASVPLAHITKCGIVERVGVADFASAMRLDRE